MTFAELSSQSSDYLNPTCSQPRYLDDGKNLNDGDKFVYNKGFTFTYSKSR